MLAHRPMHPSPHRASQKGLIIKNSSACFLFVNLLIIIHLHRFYSLLIGFPYAVLYLCLIKVTSVCSLQSYILQGSLCEVWHVHSTVAQVSVVQHSSLYSTVVCSAVVAKQLILYSSVQCSVAQQPILYSSSTVAYTLQCSVAQHISLYSTVVQH